MKKQLACFFILLISSTLARGEFVVKDSALPEEGEEVVIDLSFLASVQFEDPQFSSPKSERELASLGGDEGASFFWDSQSSSPVEWQGGQIQILQDIPYSSPLLSRKTIEAQAQQELKEESKE